MHCISYARLELPWSSDGFEIGQIANAELHADASEVGSPSLAARVTSRQFWNLANYVPKVQTHTHTHHQIPKAVRMSPSCSSMG